MLDAIRTDFYKLSKVIRKDLQKYKSNRKKLRFQKIICVWNENGKERGTNVAVQEYFQLSENQRES